MSQKLLSDKRSDLVTKILRTRRYPNDGVERTAIDFSLIDLIQPESSQRQLLMPRKSLQWDGCFVKQVQVHSAKLGERSSSVCLDIRDKHPKQVVTLFLQFFQPIPGMAKILTMKGHLLKTLGIQPMLL